MQWAGLREQDAFRRLLHLSSRKNRQMVEVARLIMEAEGALEKE